jgi:hypothetical protein
MEFKNQKEFGQFLLKGKGFEEKVIPWMVR